MCSTLRSVSMVKNIYLLLVKNCHPLLKSFHFDFFLCARESARELERVRVFIEHLYVCERASESSMCVLRCVLDTEQCACQL